MLAIEHGYIDSAFLLLENGAGYKNSFNSEGKSAYDLADERGYDDLVDLMDQKESERNI